MVTPRHETPKESFQLSEGVIPAFAATDARAPRPDVKNESFAIEVVAVARDLNLARGKKVLCHIRSDPPADPPQISCVGAHRGEIELHLRDLTNVRFSLQLQGLVELKRRGVQERGRWYWWRRGSQWAASAAGL